MGFFGKKYSHMGSDGIFFVNYEIHMGSDGFTWDFFEKSHMGWDGIFLKNRPI